jgi:exodeoxyribonuclease-5
VSIILNHEQADAVRAIRDWFGYAPIGRQTFFLSGYAGTGKTTCVKFAVGELGLGESEIAYACYTMKAALVLKRQGLPANTIHKLIYTPVPPSRAAFEEASAELAKLRDNRPADMPPSLWKARIRGLEDRLRDTTKVKFVVNDQSPLRHCRLVVIDECSMVPEEMADDLLAFANPVLSVGDPGQLPPIHGGRAPFATSRPDVLLTEIHRQARESPIIRLASMARQGQRIPHGVYGAGVRKVPRGGLDVAELLAADQVIVGTHVRRRELNNLMKLAAGFPDALPAGQGEKIIGLKNDHGSGLYNGQFVSLSNISWGGKLSFEADVLTEDGDRLAKQPLYSGYYDDHLVYDKTRELRDCWDKRELVETDWGWAITCHKAQGSGFGNVVVDDRGFGHWLRDKDGGKLCRQWLYTAITRAADKLTIVW